MKPLQNPFRAAAVATAATLALLAGAAHAADDAANARDKVTRGKYLMDTAGCMDCHTPWKLSANGPEPDLSRLYSGHPQDLAMPPAPKLPEGPWLVVASATQHRLERPVGHELHRQPDARRGDRPGPLERTRLPADLPHRPSHGARA